MERYTEQTTQQTAAEPQSAPPHAPQMQPPQPPPYPPPGSCYPPPPPPQPRRKKKVWPWVLLVILLLALLIVGGTTLFKLMDSEDSLFADKDYIAVLHVEGTMSISNGASVNSGYDHQYLLDTLQQIIYDPCNKALVLYVDSGGGEVIAADELSAAILEYKNLTGRPVYAYGHTVAASAAYWISCAADEIWLNRYCTGGSIGVTFGTMLDLSGLLDKLGIRTESINSGSQKNMGSSLEGMSEETRAIYQSFIDEYYGYFTDFICEQRGMTKEELLPLADGRIYTATQSMEHGLTDGVGDFEDCVEELRNDNAMVCDYLRHFVPVDDSTVLEQMLGLGSINGKQGALSVWPN